MKHQEAQDDVGGRRDESTVEGAEVTGSDAEEPESLQDAIEAATEEVDHDVTKLSDSCYSCSVVRKKTGESRGFCFLDFETLESAETAIYILNAGVLIAGSMVSAQLASQNQADAQAQADKQKKAKSKAARLQREESVYLPQLKIKRQAYSKDKAPGEPGGPPLRKHGARPQKSALTVLKAMRTKEEEVERVHMLRLEDQQRLLLELDNAKPSLEEVPL